MKASYTSKMENILKYNRFDKVVTCSNTGYAILSQMTIAFCNDHFFKTLGIKTKA